MKKPRRKLLQILVTILRLKNQRINSIFHENSLKIDFFRMQKLSIFRNATQDKGDVFHDPSLLLSSAVTYDIYYHGTTSCKGSGDLTDAKRALCQFHGKSTLSTISINCRQIVIKDGLNEKFKANVFKFFLIKVKRF